MELPTDSDQSYGSSIYLTPSKEDLFTRIGISSTSDIIDIKSALGLQIDPPSLSTSISTNSPAFPSPIYSSTLSKDIPSSRKKTKILPQSLLLSVTQKVRDGTVSKSDIQSSNDLKPCSSPVFLNGSSNKLSPLISPVSFNSSVESPFRSVNAFDSNTSDLDSNTSQPATKLEVSEDSENSLTAISDTSICTIHSDEETRNKKKTEKPGRKVPNYFISIQFSDPEIYHSLKDVHKSVMKKNGNYSLAVVPLHSLHMTLAVMRLDNEEDMAQAKSALNRCGDELRPKYRQELLELPLHGLGNFRHSVVFAKVHPGEHVAKLEEIAGVVQKEFCEEGLVDKQDFTPHVTVLKLSRVGKKLTKKTGLKKIYPDIYEEYVDSYFGTQKVHSLQLCSMLKAKDITGYYHVEHKIDFGTEMNPDDDGSGTIMAMRDEDSLGETTTKLTNPEPTGSKNPEDKISQDDTLTHDCSCEKKARLEDVFLGSPARVKCKSECFIYLSHEENENDPSTLSVSHEKAIGDNRRAKISTTTLSKKVPADYVSTKSINLSKNMLISEKLDNDEEIRALLQDKKILGKADVKDYKTFAGEALLKEVLPETYLSNNIKVPQVVVSQADEPTVENSTNFDIEVNSITNSLEDAPPSIATISHSEDHIIPGTKGTYENLTLSSDTGVSDISEVTGTEAEPYLVSSQSSSVLDDFEHAEEATEVLACDDLLGLPAVDTGDGPAYNETCGDEDASPATNETVFAHNLEIVPPFMRKRKKTGKCSVM